jgi:eukaryotic-like serine/threonine-protein kinase
LRRVAEQTPSDVGLDVGQVLEGKYRVDAILGQGGLGVVVACTHMGLGERRAVKMLRRDVLSDHDAVQRFIREARAAGQLKSEHVAKVFDVNLHDGDLPFMVMEFLEGADIGQLLEERTTLGATWAVDLTLQAAEALAEAHSHGIVHRDVKPSNLFVTWRPDGSAIVKVLDFGISKSPIGTDMKLTQTQSVLGTPAYMSPEQMRSAHMVDSRSDIWSLGCVLYEMIEGVRPFEADSFSEMCVKVACDPPRPMVIASPALAKVIERCLAKQPDERFASMADLGRDLVPFASNPPQAQHLVERIGRMLRRSVLGWDGADSTNSLPAVSRAQLAPQLTDKIERPERTRRVWPWAIGVFAFGAMGAALGVVTMTRHEPAGPLPQSFLDRATPPVVIARPTTPPPAHVDQPPPVVVEPPQPPVVIDVKPAVSKQPPQIHHVDTPTVDQAPVPEPGSDDPFAPQHPGMK